MILTRGEGEEREKINLKICLAGKSNPGLQHERREHWTLYQGRLINPNRNILLNVLCSSIFVNSLTWKAPSHQAWGIWTNLKSQLLNPCARNSTTEVTLRFLCRVYVHVATKLITTLHNSTRAAFQIFCQKSKYLKPISILGMKE